jgi:hypothetical protein
LVAAWLLPCTTHPLGIDWVWPPVVLLGVMSLIRGGTTILDRLILAVAQLFGAFCVAGLIISVWPWHLHPVPIVGTALTALLVIAAVTGRRPRLPVRLPTTDIVVWSATAAVAALTVIPFALRDLGSRIGMVAPGEDMARHFLLYDMIGKIGGYAFLHRTVPAGYGTGMRDYPQGTHLLYAVLDRFARSAERNADGVTAMNILLWCHLGTYLFFVLAVLWAARRVSGPGPTAATLLPVLVGVAGVLYFGDLLTLFLRGYPNELLGLALVAILTALLARPLARPCEQLVTVTALLVGVSFSYHLFLPYAVVVTAVWAWRARSTLRRVPRFCGAAALFLPFTLLMPLENRPAGTPTLLLAMGTAYASDRSVLVLALLTALLGLATGGGWRSPARRLLTVAVAVAVAMVAALLTYQYAMVGHSVYYFEKLVHMLLVVALVAVGSVARRLPRVWFDTTGVARRLTPGIAGAFAVTLFMAGLGGRWHSDPFGSHGVRYAVGMEQGSPAGGRLAVAVTETYPDGAGAVTVVLARTPYANFYATLFGAAMRRDYRDGEGWYVFLSPAGRPRTVADMEAKVRASPVRIRLIVGNPLASFLVVDPEHPHRPVRGPGVDPASFGDPAALTNVEAAEFLAQRYPGRVEIVRLKP